jgi:AcrR family transcriptional regulator
MNYMMSRQNGVDKNAVLWTYVHMNNRSGQETKNRILDSARRVFAEHGYARASMRLIARSAGTSVGGLYLYFKDKEDLYLNLTRESFDYLNLKTREALQGIMNPEESIRCFITMSIEYAQNHRERIVFQGRELGISFGSDIKRKFSIERRELIEDIIREGIAQGIFRDCNPTETARIIFSTLRGFVVTIALDDDALFSSEEFVKLILNGLLSRESE